jgi:hypothetical protein
MDKLSGGNVNYYLIDVPDKYTAEVEDIIETLHMEFAEGTIFKCLIRLCKLRQDSGKPGSTKKYESEKIKYYGDRVLAKAQRKDNQKSEFYVIWFQIIVEHPKRLKPYVVYIADIIAALNMDSDESELLINLIKYVRFGNIHYAEEVKKYTDIILEKI